MNECDMFAMLSCRELKKYMKRSTNIFVIDLNEAIEWVCCAQEWYFIKYICTDLGRDFRGKQITISS